MRKQRKSGSARQPGLPFPEAGEPPRAFWQARFYDFNVYSKGKKTGKLSYMHVNPVTRGLVEHPEGWPWSSWRSTGKARRDWCISTLWSEKKRQPKTQVPNSSRRSILRVSFLVPTLTERLPVTTLFPTHTHTNGGEEVGVIVNQISSLTTVPLSPFDSHTSAYLRPQAPFL
jgi:hypothetical protein